MQATPVMSNQLPPSFYLVEHLARSNMSWWFASTRMTSLDTRINTQIFTHLHIYSHTRTIHVCIFRVSTDRVNNTNIGFHVCDSENILMWIGQLMTIFNGTFFPVMYYYLTTSTQTYIENKLHSLHFNTPQLCIITLIMINTIFSNNET